VTGTRIGLLAAWLVLLALPLGWWLLRSRGRVDVWRHLPVPGAVLDREGRVRARGGPPGPVSWPPADRLPAPGAIRRTAGPDGTPVALAGVPGGALAFAVEADPGLSRRHRQVTTLVPLLQHEIRGGLQGVLGHLGLVAEAGLDESGRRSVARCQREVGRLLEVVDGAELLARIAGTQPAREVVEVGYLLEEATAGLEQVLLDLPEATVRVEVVAWQLIRALRNLVENALRHGAPPVAVAARVVGEEVRFTIRDAGSGIPAADFERLAAPFARGAGGAPGSGLGLTIAVEAVSAHGGALATLPGGALEFGLPRAPA